MCILGGGFYSVIASYFNSDCNPNTVRINMGREMFLVATRNIRKGEFHLLGNQLFSTVTNSLKGRRSQTTIVRSSANSASRLENSFSGWVRPSLSTHQTCHQENFLFSCECEACEEEWPTYSQLPSSSPSQKVADKLCEYEMDNMEAMGKGEIDKALSFHCKEISLIQVKPIHSV